MIYNLRRFYMHTYLNTKGSFMVFLVTLLVTTITHLYDLTYMVIHIRKGGLAIFILIRSVIIRICLSRVKDISHQTGQNNLFTVAQLISCRYRILYGDCFSPCRYILQHYHYICDILLLCLIW